MMRIGKVFEEFDSDSSAMIVLEGDAPLGEDAHRFYDDMIAKLRADTKHVQHIQDFWGDPLTEAGAQSEDGKAAYVQVYLAGNMGEALGNESVIAAQKLVDGLTPPPGVKVYRHRRARATGRPGERGQRERQDHRDRDGRRHHHHAAVLLPLDRHRPAGVDDHGVEPVGHPRCGGRPRLQRPHRAVDVRDSAPGDPGDRRNHRLRNLSHRALPGGPSVGQDKESAYYTMFHGTAHVVLGSGMTIAGATFCLSFTRLPYFQSLGIPLAVGMVVAVLVALTLGPAIITVASRFGLLEPKRAMRIRFWRRLGAAVVRWPGGILTATILLALIGLLTLPGYRPSYNDRQYLPADLPSHEGFAAAERHFPRRPG